VMAVGELRSMGFVRMELKCGDSGVAVYWCGTAG